MQLNTNMGIATISAWRRGDSQVALGILAQPPANTMQLDTTAASPQSAQLGTTASTIIGSVAKSACEQTGKCQLALGPLIEMARCKATQVDRVASDSWHCLMAVMPGITKQHIIVTCNAAITTDG